MEKERHVVGAFNLSEFDSEGEYEVPIGSNSWSHHEKPKADLMYRDEEATIVEAKRGWTINRFSAAVGQLLCYEHMYERYETDDREVRKVAVLGKGSYNSSEKPTNPTGWNEHKKIAKKHSIDLYTVTFFDGWFDVKQIRGYQEGLFNYSVSDEQG